MVAELAVAELVAALFNYTQQTVVIQAIEI